MRHPPKKQTELQSTESDLNVHHSLLFLLLFSGFLFVLRSLLDCLNVFVVYDCVYIRQCSFQTLQRTLMLPNCVWYNVNLVLTSCLQSFWCSKPQLFFKLCIKLYLFFLLACINPFLSFSSLIPLLLLLLDALESIRSVQTVSEIWLNIVENVAECHKLERH